MSESSPASGPAGALSLRYGLIGCGDIGVVRAAALEGTSSKLVAATDVDVNKASAIAAKHGAAVEKDWRSLIARPEVEAVIISTPPSLHAEMAIAALESGKHVLCEKPLARTPDECRSMIDAAQKSGRVLATGHNYRFYPSFELARDVLASGRIGQLSHIRAYAGYSATGHNQPWVKDASVVGGGALHDNGIHMIDLVRSFLGEVEEVQGFATGRVWKYGDAEDNGFLLMRGAQGCIATLHASWTEWGRYQFRIELVGNLGKIVATCFPMRTEILWTDAVGGRTRSQTNRFIGTMIGEHAKSYRWVVAQSFAREYDAFARAIRGETSAIASGLDGMRAIEIASSATHLNGQTRAPRAAFAGRAQ